MSLFASRSTLTQVAAAAAGCALWLAAANPSLAAGTPAVASPAAVLATVTTAERETITFTGQPDGSVGISGVLPLASEHQSITAGRRFASPLAVFRAAAPNVSPPAALVQADARFTDALRANAASTILSPAFGSAQGPRRPNVSPSLANSQQWFINDFCKPAQDASFHVCYTDAYGWAYLDASSVYYGHSAAAALNHGLIFTVRPVGQWYVPRGYYRWAYEYHYSPHGWNNFAFDASVNDAGYFDFQADVDY